MSYTNNLDNPELYFQTKLYTGTGSSHAITLDGSENMQPDWVWTKGRGDTYSHMLYDSVRGATKELNSHLTDAETTVTNSLTSFNSDGFTLGSFGESNDNSQSYVAWNWSAGGASPSITYSVKVVSDSGNKYRFDDFGTSAVTLDLQEGGTYTFDQSDSSNSGHPLRFSTTSNGTHGGGSEYTTNVTTTGTPGNSGAKTVITVAASAPTLYYYCTQHSAMGGQANTNSTFGSSNFSGSIQSTVSAGSTQGFSIVSYTGTGSNATVGHGLGSAPSWIVIKGRNQTEDWTTYHASTGNTKNVILNSTAAADTHSTYWQDTSPTSSVFYLGSSTRPNNSSTNYIAYCFAEKKGFSKFGSFTGNGNADGTFVYTGFKPAFIIEKLSSGTGSWLIYDNKRNGINGDNHYFYADGSDAELTTQLIDITSNGFKHRHAGGANSSGTSIYMAFAENPFVTAGTKAAGTAR